MKTRFEDKVAFVTGGASGFGAMAARRLTGEGAKVVVTDINGDGAKSVAAELAGATAIALDVTDPVAVEAAFATTLETYGRVDVIINNAGSDSAPHPLHEVELGNWQKVSSVNGDGAYFVMRYGIAALLRNDGGGGAIVNTVSVAGMVGVPGLTPYTYAKAGIIGLTRSAAHEYAAHNIRVNAVAPGSTLTPMLEDFISMQSDPATFRTQIENASPLPGFVHADSVVGTMLFLASEDAASITGLTIPVDNGQTAI